jgi:UDP-N-acetylglucosamine transferase subunit ALG13
MQRGAAAAPRNGVSHDYLSHDELMRLLADADVVVTQGGPTGIIESRRRGIRPIAVPRLAALGEHVDNHQVAFCTQLAAVGDVVLAQSRVELCRALDAALQNPGIYRIEPSEAKVAVSETVRRFELLAAGLLHERRRSLFSRSQRR